MNTQPQQKVVETINNLLLETGYTTLLSIILKNPNDVIKIHEYAKLIEMKGSLIISYAERITNLFNNEVHDGKFIVLETFGGADYAIVAINEDGSNKVFDNDGEAQEEANNCQEGIVIPIYPTWYP